MNAYLGILDNARPGDREPPATPTGLTASEIKQTSLRLSWAPAFDNQGVSVYGIYRDGLLADTMPATTALVTGLLCGRTYRFEVDAADEAGQPLSAGDQGARDLALPAATPASASAASFAPAAYGYRPAGDDDQLGPAAPREQHVGLVHVRL